MNASVSPGPVATSSPERADVGGSVRDRSTPYAIAAWPAGGCPGANGPSSCPSSDPSAATPLVWGRMCTGGGLARLVLIHQQLQPGDDDVNDARVTSRR